MITPKAGKVNFLPFMTKGISLNSKETESYVKEIIIEDEPKESIISGYYNADLNINKQCYLKEVLISGDYGNDDDLRIYVNNVIQQDKLPILLPPNCLLTMYYITIGLRRKREKKEFETVDEYSEYLLDKLNGKMKNKLKITLTFEGV